MTAPRPARQPVVQRQPVVKDQSGVKRQPGSRRAAPPTPAASDGRGPREVVPTTRPRQVPAKKAAAKPLAGVAKAPVKAIPVRSTPRAVPVPVAAARTPLRPAPVHPVPKQARTPPPRQAAPRGPAPTPPLRPVAPRSPAPAPSATPRTGPSGSPEPTPTLRAAAEFVVLGALAVAIVVVVRVVLVQAFYIPSGSMLPQLQLQDKVVVSRLAYHFHAPRRGDIIVFDAPPNMPREGTVPQGGSALRRAIRWAGQRLGLAATTDELIKRVIALPGDTVEGRDGHVYINGRLLLEPYLPPGTEMSQPFGPVKVPPDRLWVMGDNRNNSYDSRFFGPIREHSIVGRAFLRVWPVTHISFL